MRRSGFLLAAAAIAALALSPAAADARAGGGSSMGSRGMRTYSAPPSTNTAPGGAQPMQRSITPAPAPAQPGLAGQSQPRRGGFMSGLAGGLLGAGLIGLLFGGGIFGGGFAGFIGALLQMALIGGLVWFVLRRFRGPRLATAGGPAMFTGPGAAGGIGAAPLNRAGGAPSGPPVQVTPADFTAFEQKLKDVQAAWSSQSLPLMQRLVTLEMLGYFESQFAQQASQGVRNTVTDVKLLQGDLAEAWAEDGREYATVAMRFGMIDVTRDMAGRVVGGDPARPVQATELWTFVRTPGGNWMLSAIQQAA